MLPNLACVIEFLCLAGPEQSPARMKRSTWILLFATSQQVYSARLELLWSWLSLLF